MRKPKQIYDEVYKELMEEFGLDDMAGKAGTFDEIENITDQFGREFERRVIEKTVHEQRDGIDKKKAVKSAADDSRTSGSVKR